MIKLSEGSGGVEMQKLISAITEGFDRGKWKQCENDSAILDIGGKKLGLTTDSFTIDPIFFPGGDIGHVAVCGTINDLAVMGIEPLGLTLGLIIEEGFPREDLLRIMGSISAISKEIGIPVATGDTKVMGKGKIDRIVINTSGVGLADQVLDEEIKEGDSIVLSGSIGDHAVALLSKRFDYETSVVTDSMPILEEVRAVKHIIKQAKDPTRGGLAMCLHEFGCGLVIEEEKIPVKKEVRAVTEMLGLNLYELACEGRFVCITNKPDEVVEILRRYDSDASVIGTVSGEKVIIQTSVGKRFLQKPTGNLVPRIC